MRWFPLLVLLPGCFEYGLNPRVTDPDPGPGMSLGNNSPGVADEPSRDPADEDWSDPADEQPTHPNRGDYQPFASSLHSLLTEAASADSEDPADETLDWWNEPWSEPPAGYPDGDGGGSQEDGEDGGSNGGSDGGGTGGTGGSNGNGGLARMTGGGGFGEFHTGFTVHCEDHNSNEMVVDMPGGAKFKMGGIDWIICLDDPELDSQQPYPQFDTVVGVVWGTVRGEDAQMWFVFTDDGEPGTDDHADLEIVQGSHTWSAAGYLVQGNHQVHDPVGN